MYTHVQVEPKDTVIGRRYEGHIYDISEAGVRIELDEPLQIGEAVRLTMDLPGQTDAIVASGNVVWIHDADDDPGPRRMALSFSGFSSSVDQIRLASFMTGRAGLQEAA